MGNVVIVPLATQVGHLNPTLALARALDRRGHRVTYLALRELEPSIRAQGLAYAPLFGDVRLEVPPGRGWLGQRQAAQTTRELRAQIPWNNRMLGRMLSGEASAELEALRPDAVLVDNMWLPVALVAHELKLPVAMFATTPEFRRGQVARSLAARAADVMLGGLSRALGLRFRSATRTLAERCGLPARSFDLDGLLPRFIGPEIPELLLYPEDLDDSAAAPGLHVGPTLDLARHEPALDLTGLPPKRELLYCALGTRDLARAEALRIFRPILEAASRRPASTLILAAGAHAAALGAVPEQVRVVDRAPQLALLRRATLMITHGGLGSIKESIYFQVPMVVVPLRFDQKTNAARVERQRLGIALGARRRSAAAIGRAIETVLGDPVYRQNLARASARLRADEERAAAVTHVEALLARRSGDN